MSRYGNDYILNFPEAKTLLRNTGNFIMENGRGWYNCGGFALGRPEWYLPYDKEVDEECNYIREDYDFNNITREECCTQIGRLYVDYMCASEEVREICTHAELREDEYLVLFKASYDDFHYVRQMDDGRWFHKNGSSFIQMITDDEAYSDEWWYDLPCNYDGELFMLAVKKPNHKKNRIFLHQIRNNKRKILPRRKVVYGGHF
jgi:hypothetical protein